MKLLNTWLENRRLVDEVKLSTKYDNFEDILADNGVDYPHESSTIDLDSVGADNYKGFLRNSKIWIKKLSKLLPDGVKPINENFSMHLGFIDTFNGERFKYYPMVLEFEDGQMLVGLARQYGDAQDKMVLDRREAIKITRWFLNGEDITKAVYKSRSAISDEQVELKNIASLIKGISKTFQKKNPKLEKEIKKLEKEKAQLEKDLDAKNKLDKLLKEADNSQDFDKLAEIKEEIDNLAGGNQYIKESVEDSKWADISGSYKKLINKIETLNTLYGFFKAGNQYGDYESVKEVVQEVEEFAKQHNINLEDFAEYGEIVGKMEAMKEDEQEELEQEFKDLVEEALSIKDVSDAEQEHKLTSLFEDIQNHPIGLSEEVKNEELYNDGVKKVGEHINKLLEEREAKQSTNEMEEYLNIVLSAQTLEDFSKKEIEEAIIKAEELYNEDNEKYQDGYNQIIEHMNNIALGA